MYSRKRLININFWLECEMRFITVLILLLIPSLSYGMSKDEKIKIR